MKYLMILTCLLLTSCGSDRTFVTNNPGSSQSTPATDQNGDTFVASDYVGIWTARNAQGGDSYIELQETANGQIRIETSGQVLTSVNPNNDSQGTHPVLSGNFFIQDGKIFILNRNATYSSTTHDLEEDNSNSNITGARRTDAIFERQKDGSLKLTIKIFAGAVNTNVQNVDAERVFNFD